MKRLPILLMRTVLCVAIAAVTLELCARTEDRLRYGAPFFGNYNMESLYAYDRLGKYGKPGASYMKWHLNEAGYRGPAIRTGAYTIACLGASETFGLYESPGMEWPRQLETILNAWAGDRGYQVVDTSFPGMTAGTALKRVPQIVAAVHPSLVVIYPYYAGYIDRTQAEPWPLPDPATVAPAIAPKQHIEFRMPDRLRNFWKANLPEKFQNSLRFLQLQSDSDSAKAADRIPDEDVRAFQTDLDHLVQSLQDRHIAVILITHATRFGKTVRPEDRPILTAWRKFYPDLKEDGLIDMEARMSDALRKVGDQRHVPVVDGASLIQPGSTNFAEFVHFTDAGAKALATLAANEIEHEVQSGVLPAAPTPSGSNPGEPLDARSHSPQAHKR